MKTFVKRVCFENWSILNYEGRKLSKEGRVMKKKKKKNQTAPYSFPRSFKTAQLTKLTAKEGYLEKKILILFSLAVCSTLLFIVCVKVRIEVEELGRDGSKRVDHRGRECERDAG